MSILNVNQLQPVGGGNTITVGSSNIDYSGSITGNISVDGNLTVTGVVSHEDVTNIDSLGIVTVTAFHGDGSALTGITGTTINNNADNRLITGSGTANTLEGEANLTFNGSKLVLAANSTAYDAFQVGDGLFIGNTTNNVSAAIFHQGGGADLEIGSQDMITFTTGNTAGNATERLRIDSSGNIGLGESLSIDARLHVNSGTDNTTLFLESTDGDVNLGMADNAGSCRLLQSGGNLRFRTGGNANAFGTGDSERMVLDSSGNLGLGGITSPSFTTGGGIHLKRNESS